MEFIPSGKKDDCRICFKNLEGNVVKLTCCHRFCEPCIRSMVKRHGCEGRDARRTFGLCPLCRCAFNLGQSTKSYLKYNNHYKPIPSNKSENAKRKRMARIRRNKTRNERKKRRKLYFRIVSRQNEEKWYWIVNRTTRSSPISATPFKQSKTHWYN